MPDFCFALLAIGVLVTGLKDVVQPQTSPIFYSIGLHSEGQSGFNLDYLRHLFLPVMVLAFTSVATWSRFHRGIDARRIERRLRAHRARQGRAAVAR